MRNEKEEGLRIQRWDALAKHHGLTSRRKTFGPFDVDFDIELDGTFGTVSLLALEPWPEWLKGKQ